MKSILPLLLLAALVIVAISALSPSHAPTKAQHSSGSYVQLARADAIQAGIDPNIFVRQINQESGFQTTVVSSAGAIGIAQFMPETAKGLGINPYDPVESLQGAAQLMARYIQHYGSEALALAAYNAGSGTVNRCLQTSDWYGCLPGETQNYISIILQR